MRYASLGSGSQGNATLIETDEVLILVDCGFTVKETTRRMERLGVSPGDLNAVLVTHEHGDHIKGVGPLARRFGIPVYMTPGTYHQASPGELPELRLIEGYQSFQVGDLQVTPVAVPHDAREPTQFVVATELYRLGILTDLGSLSEHVVNQYRDCHALLVEANHDPAMLATGPYPPSLKRRVAGQWGHLSNDQALQLLELLDAQRLQQLVIGHISQKNNCLDLVQRLFAPWTEKLPMVKFACQDEGFDWLEIASADVSDIKSRVG
ncbi:MBL fold metallo-hydrolase [Halioxenophilus sp. WMMB6]|uniref:MBL fold metallo-hydrolase n=1 Tax=Halioxenophilus sp. WMMB6 TaxID=3073815 RepID=UPI00295E317E|nr:MBL fold metallo-hydrolase [Halioxenophilus sp. WMMB6]